ncbi:hypothetical protein HPB48_015118 [Haemaphysalis longicornis]|uniref:Uncharacterized protein n=1 Tax=Haemaphysalis longicornis TaxID=44386 RepID=A0A9J6G5A9_HAELO|nr:hypothetical protein HPB48_015118 [Haemaphysalis longicornis]
MALTNLAPNATGGGLSLTRRRARRSDIRGTSRLACGIVRRRDTAGHWVSRPSRRVTVSVEWAEPKMGVGRRAGIIARAPVGRLVALGRRCSPRSRDGAPDDGDRSRADRAFGALLLPLLLPSLPPLPWSGPRDHGGACRSAAARLSTAPQPAARGTGGAPTASSAAAGRHLGRGERPRSVPWRGSVMRSEPRRCRPPASCCSCCSPSATRLRCYSPSTPPGSRGVSAPPGGAAAFAARRACDVGQPPCARAPDHAEKPGSRRRKADSAFDELPDNSRLLVVDRLKRYPENERLIASIPSRIYEVIYPVQVRHHQKLGISTRDTTANKATTFLPPRCFKSTSTLTAFGSCPVRRWSTVTTMAPSKTTPGAVAAFRTCSGISGIIHIRNETFVIHPFYGGDLSFDARNSTRSEVMSDAIQIIKLRGHEGQGCYRRRAEGEHYLPAPCGAQYFRTVNTRVSIVYLETWATGDQMEHTSDIRQALLNFVDYSAKNLYKQAVDATHLLTGRHFPSREVGMAIPDTVCTAKAVGISQDTNVYEPHLVASTVTHMLGHNLGMSHDDGGNCQCQDSWGCIMAPGILGTNHIQPYHFSSCSLEEYINALRIGHGICLFNKPGQLEDFRTCGNGVKEQDEDCDCGTMEECAKTDPCCDPITCKLRVEANCSAGPCCENCKLRAAGQLCRTPESECDIPEFCDGRSGECPANIYKKNGQDCKKGSGFCYRGKCQTSDDQCEYIWGFGARRSDEKCFGEFNVQGSMSGNCGPDGRGGYVKCSREHMMCGTLQCQRGTRTPIVTGMEKLYTRTIISIEGSEFECKVSTGSISSDIPDIGIVWDGTKCGASKICVNKSCLPVEHFRELGVCPSNNLALACSGHGVCSNVNTCYCDEGYLGPDCSQRANATQAPPPLPPPAATPAAPPPAPAATDVPSRTNKSSRTTSYVGRKDALSTPSLVIVLVSVVGGVFIFFALLATCYRQVGAAAGKGPSQALRHLAL